MVGLFLVMEVVEDLFIAKICTFKPGVLGTLMFREDILWVPYVADESFGIMYAVLNNLPLSVLIFNNENLQY
jgi:hypothetical protein